MALPLLGIAKLFAPVIDKLIPDREAASKAKYELAALEQQGELEMVRVSLSAILAEAQSTDKWTSRARPSFMYCFYLFLLTHGLALPVLAAFAPIDLHGIYTAMGEGLAAIPDGLWWTFASGYLGYTAARQVGKIKGTDK